MKHFNPLVLHDCGGFRDPRAYGLITYAVENVNYIHDDFGGEDYKEHVIMQYTGLKDRNGKEIYDGDVVRRWAKDWSDCVSRGMAPDRWDFLISFNGPFVGCVGTNPRVHNPLDMQWSPVGFEDGTEPLDDCEVIGNLYENPELLEP